MSWIELTDLTCLYPDVVKKEYEELLEVAKRYKVASIVVPPTFDPLFDIVDEYNTCSVVNWPQGWNGWWLEQDFEYIIRHKVKEIDVVLPICLIKDHNWLMLEEKLRLMRNYAKSHVLKGIIETGLLTTDEIQKITHMLKKADFNFVKTCTGVSARGVTLDDIRVIKEAEPSLKIKASGGIKEVSFAEQLLRVGADRLGIGFRNFKKMVG